MITARGSQGRSGRFSMPASRPGPPYDPEAIGPDLQVTQVRGEVGVANELHSVRVGRAESGPSNRCAPTTKKIGVVNRCRTYNAIGISTSCLSRVFLHLPGIYGFNLYIVPDDHPTSSQADCVSTPNPFSCPLGVAARRHCNHLDR